MDQDIISNRITNCTPESPLFNMKGNVTVTGNKQSDGPRWLREIYDQPVRKVMGAFGR